MSNLSALLNCIDEIKDNLNDKQYKEIMDKLMELNKDKEDIYYELEYEEIVMTPFAHTDEDGETHIEIKETHTLKKQFIKVIDGANRNIGWRTNIRTMMLISEIDRYCIDNDSFLNYIKKMITIDFYTSKIIYRINKFEKVK